VHLLAKNNFDVIKTHGTTIKIIAARTESFDKRHCTAPAVIFFDRDVKRRYHFFDEVPG